jgi:hypothetical protein
MTIVHAGLAPARAGERFLPLDPTHPLVTAHRPLALAILTDYGSPTDGADRVKAIVDWVARTAIHGHEDLRAGMSVTDNVATLPIGADWSDVTAQLTEAQQEIDNEYWADFNHDAAAMLDVLLGTLQPNGTRLNDGTMEHVSGSLYRYRSVPQIRSVWCSWQHSMCTLLLATLGYPSMLASIIGHDPMRVQYGERGEWGYFCATYNESYELTGGSASLDLLDLRDLGPGAVVPIKHSGPTWDPMEYITASYLGDNPGGWPEIAIVLDSRIVPSGAVNRQTRAVESPTLDASGLFPTTPRCSERVARPYLGAYIRGLPIGGRFRVDSNWPGTVGFVRRNGGTWVASPPLGFVGPVAVEIAPIDTHGQRGPAILVEP